jgi:hypothetical protein
MKRLLVALAFVCLLSPGMSAAVEQMVINGFTYFTPPEGVGTQATLVAQLDPPYGFDYPMTVDFSTNEYTFYFQSTIQSISVGPVTTTISYADASFAIYEDPSKNGDYGVNPPNGTSPSTFQDGTPILTGTLSNVTRIDYNLGFPEPTIVADCTFTGGTKLSELIQGNNWTLHGGISSNPLAGIPTGYQQSWSLKIVFSGPLPVEEYTWGGIKALYGGK